MVPPSYYKNQCSKWVLKGSIGGVGGFEQISSRFEQLGGGCAMFLGCRMGTAIYERKDRVCRGSERARTVAAMKGQ